MKPFDYIMIAGYRIYYFRILQGLEAKELAYLCDVEPSFISAIESGKHHMTLETIARIAIGLHMEPDILIKPWKNWPEVIEYLKALRKKHHGRLPKEVKRWEE